MPKVILLSQFPLPYSKIGSWTTMYKNYFEGDSKIDYIVCPKPNSFFENVQYSVVEITFLNELKKKIVKDPYIDYIEALEKIIVANEKCIIQIVDNFGIVKPLSNFLRKKYKRENFYLQFFYHGFAPFYGNFQSRIFFESIDEMILLTNDSYKAHKNYYTILPTRFSVLQNGINTQKFYFLDQGQKKILKHKLNIADKKIFMWCSQDRPKKGLDLILDAWKRVYPADKNIELWIIGTERNESINGVKFIGRIENDLLPEYFQISDVYLFPTLCHEGFGLSLIEALHCGCYCIASASGGVPEVLQYGKFGKLIENPHFVQEWVDAIESYLMNSFHFDSIPPSLYSQESWNDGMNKIIESAKKSL